MRVNRIEFAKLPSLLQSRLLQMIDTSKNMGKRWNMIAFNRAHDFNGKIIIVTWKSHAQIYEQSRHNARSCHRWLLLEPFTPCRVTVFNVVVIVKRLVLVGIVF